MNQNLKIIITFIIGLTIGLASFAAATITQTGPNQITICYVVNNATTFLNNYAYSAQGPRSVNMTAVQKANITNIGINNYLKNMNRVGARGLYLYQNNVTVN